MKLKFFKNFNFLGELILLTHLVYIILSESKKDLLNDIIIFENTNGDIYLAKDINDEKLIFGTTLSNEEDRIFYGLIDFSEKYIFKDNEDLVPFITKNINRTVNKKISNAKMGLFEYGDDIFIILIGTDDSYIEIFNINDYSNHLNLYNASDFFPRNTINKGISPLIYSGYSTEYLFLISSSIYNNDSMNYFITANRFQISIEDSIFNYELDYNRSFNNIKNENIDCFAFNLELYSCIYLDIDNNYKINIIENTDSDFTEKNSITLGNISNPIDGEFYFLKGILVPILNANYFHSTYVYYSGNLNDIPTFHFIYINKEDFTFSNKYNDEFPVVYLYDYPFNNGLKYNDLVNSQAYTSFEDFFFVSTNKDKEYLIISYLIFFISSETSKTKLSIRYYTIQLKDYFNMNIFHGFKIVIFSSQNYLTLAFDFCLIGQCESSNNGNSALMIFSYINKTQDIMINFTEYVFTNNRLYIITNLSEIFSISNNIFGYILDIELEIMDYGFFYNDENGIDIYYGIDSLPFFDEYLPIEDALLKIDFSNYNFDEPYYDINEELEFYLSIVAFPEEDLNIFNSYCDKVNDTFGDINDEASYQFDYKYSLDSIYNLNMKEEFSSKCNDSNCSLCLRNDPNYCIVCIDDNYTIISDEIYGKRKICQIEENEDFPTEPLSDLPEKLTEIETTNIGTTYIISNTIINKEISYSSNIYIENVDTTNVDITIIDSTIPNSELSHFSNGYM